jgi:hypothetical protein
MRFDCLNTTQDDLYDTVLFQFAVTDDLRTNKQCKECECLIGHFVRVIDTIVVVDDANLINTPLVGVHRQPRPVVFVDGRDDLTCVWVNLLVFNEDGIVDTKTDGSSSLFPVILGWETKVVSDHCRTPLRVIVQPRDWRLVIAVATEGVPEPAL